MLEKLNPQPSKAVYITIPLIYFLSATAFTVVTDFLIFNTAPDSGFGLTVFLKNMSLVMFTTAVLWFFLRKDTVNRNVTELSFKKLVENLNDVVFVLQAPSRTIVYANPAATKVFGYSKEEFIGQTTDFLNVSVNQIEDFYRKAVPLLDQNKPYQGEYELVNKDGELVPIRILVSTFEDISGERYALSVVSDLTPIKKEQERVNDHEILLQQLAENLREVFWVMDPKTNTMEYISPSYEQVWGRDIGEAYSDPLKFLETIHPEDKPAIEPRLSRLNSHNYDAQYRILKEDGTVRWIRDKCYPISNQQGEVYRILGIVEDITELKQHEIEESRTRRLESLANLTNGIAHDFNNFLLIILSNSELLDQLIQDDPETPETKELLDQIIKSTKEAADLTKRLLMFSKSTNVEKEYVNLHDTCEALIANFQPSFLGHCTIELDIPLQLWSLNVDRDSLETCLENLIANARDAMPHSGVIRLTANNTILTSDNIREEENANIHPGDYIKISVIDSGTGITDDVAERMFEPFFTTKHAEDSQGLGLSMVYGFVRQSKGYIKAVSANGGTSINMYLPRGYQL